MRSLIYVPVIHEAVDLGSVSAAAHKKGDDILGPKEWERHKGVVNAFWERISDYFKDFDATGLEIFQDGLPVDGEIALRIIREGAERGSRNYRIILDLLNRGGIIKKTEDIKLLQRELVRTRYLTHGDPFEETEAVHNLISEDQLIAERDRFTARCINETLTQRGVLFMGAFHRVPDYLEKDINLLELKKIKNVQAYLKILYAKGPREILTSLSDHMISPIELHV